MENLNNLKTFEEFNFKKSIRKTYETHIVDGVIFTDDKSTYADWKSEQKDWRKFIENKESVVTIGTNNLFAPRDYLNKDDGFIKGDHIDKMKGELDKWKKIGKEPAYVYFDGMLDTINIENIISSKQLGIPFFLYIQAGDHISDYVNNNLLNIFNKIDPDHISDLRKTPIHLK